MTIIVILILAGATISTLTGENGLINRAVSAKENMEIEATREELTLAIEAVQVEYYTRGTNVSFEEYILYRKADIEEALANGKTIGIDKNNKKITYDGYEFSLSDDGDILPEKPTKVDTVLAQIGDYVKYNVSYTDMFTNYEFNKTNGWRILDAGTYDAVTKSYSGVKLISTGIPATLLYNRYNERIKDYEYDGRTKGKWAGNTEQRNNYINEFNLNNSEANSIYATAGLYYNFDHIVFKNTTNDWRNIENKNYNYGRYIKINGKTGDDIEGNEFIAQDLNGNISRVYNLTLEELNKARGNTADTIYENDGDTGLFYLVGLQKENIEYGYKIELDPGYWLASTKQGWTKGIYNVWGEGKYNGAYDAETGIRPVICLDDVKLVNKDGVWEINE